ncbi:cytochrome c biogenesis CcdA family protein [Roseibium aestuarii]|uniref:Cytochrome c biogenesis CcdA family protein n=1 Tax=Roseibium aestuarii TaxID=2600299 RepID=A0ABW4JUM4_9HYPH|nr:cytochrome c biogenesis protein CcdA [Roseibium aestuarii]
MLQDLTLWGAVFAGLLSFVSPCVLPLVPPYLGFLAGVSLDELRAGDARADVSRRVFFAALAFVAGFSTVFIALGASASVVGQFLAWYRDIFTWIAGGLIILMGLHFLGAFRIGLLYREARIQVERKPAGLLGAYFIGLAFAFGWTPCIGPILAAILTVASSKASVAQGVILLAAYALGLAIPFLLAAAFARPFLGLMQRFRRHMGVVEKVMGVFLILTGIALLFGVFTSFSALLQEWFPVLTEIG